MIQEGITGDCFGISKEIRGQCSGSEAKPRQMSDESLRWTANSKADKAQRSIQVRNWKIVSRIIAFRVRGDSHDSKLKSTHALWRNSWQTLFPRTVQRLGNCRSLLRRRARAYIDIAERQASIQGYRQLIYFNTPINYGKRYISLISQDSESMLIYVFLFRQVHGSLARAGKVKSQTPKVEKQEKKKTPKGRAKKRMLYNRRWVGFLGVLECGVNVWLIVILDSLMLLLYLVGNEKCEWSFFVVIDVGRWPLAIRGCEA